MISPKAESARDAAKLALQQALAALDRAANDEDVRTVLEVIEGYGSWGLAARISPLSDVERQMRASSDRLSRISSRRKT